MLTLPNETAPHAAFVDTVREDGNILLERKVMTIVIVWLYLNWTEFFNIYVIVNKVVALSALMRGLPTIIALVCRSTIE